MLALIAELTPQSAGRTFLAVWNHSLPLRLGDSAAMPCRPSKTPSPLGFCICFLAMQLGCGAVLTTAVSTPHSILKGVRSGPDRATLEVFQIRIPAKDYQLVSQLWQSADEQRLTLETRHRLVSNGFRAGVIGGVLPDALAQFLELDDEVNSTTDPNERIITDETATSKITRRILQLKRSEPATIQVSEIQPSVNVLINSPDGIQGKSYPEAQGVYTLRAETVPGQQIEVQLTPELHFGELKNRYSGSDQGVIVFTPSRERKTFDDMKIAARLSAGEMLLVMGMPGASGSLGDAIHSQQHSDIAEQKLVMVRLVEVPESEILADSELLK